MPGVTLERGMGPEMADIGASDSTGGAPSPRSAGNKHALAYVLLILLTIVVALPFSLRYEGIFACGAGWYAPDSYLSYCNSKGFGDYDHGAFWFDLEPKAVEAARQADVLFLGNSRLELGFSTQGMSDWFASIPARPYLLGFTHFGNYRFAAPLLARLHPKARAYVINLDLFFEPDASPPAATVMRDESAERRYTEKRFWEGLHRPVCTAVPGFCRDEMVLFRSRTTGWWVRRGSRPQAGPVANVAYSDAVDTNLVKAYTAAARGFLSLLPVRDGCIILTMVPSPETAIATGVAIADALNLPFVAPRTEGLSTFDGSHLDERSAAIWSAAFIADAGPMLRGCLAAARESVPAAGSRP